MVRKLKHPSNLPWVILHQFPTYEDAKAFQALVEEQFGIANGIARPKQQYESAGNVANWRMTIALRKELSGNSFDMERLQIAAEINNYSYRSVGSWLNKCTKYGVVKALGEGFYEFLPPVASTTSTPQAGDNSRPLASVQEGISDGW